MSDQSIPLRVAHIHGYGTDPDLEQLRPDQLVHIELIDVYEPDYVALDDVDADSDEAYVDELATIYRVHGPWALPPVVCMDDAGWQIAGLHRMRAAHRAGLKHIPAFIVHTQ